MNLVFEWDASKAESNLRKHKISFDEAKLIFNDPFLITFADNFHSNTEERFISIGSSPAVPNRLLLVIHTEEHRRGDELIIRIISCRRATATERRIYEQSE
jgi:hypothetical protein